MSENTDLGEVLNFPFDENKGATTLYDYSPSAINTQISGTAAIIAGGKVGNCLQIGGAGTNDEPTSPVDPAGDYTISIWLRRDTLASDVAGYYEPEHLSLFFHGSTDADNSTEKIYDLIEGAWTHVAIVKDGLDISVYINGTKVEDFTLSEQPDYILLQQDACIEGETYVSIDDFVVYDSPLTESQITELYNSITNATHQLRYYIDGIDIRETYGIRFESSNGLLSRPKLKEPTKIDWPDYHGDAVDLTGKRFEARTITLKGWMPAANKTDFVQKWNEFLSLFDSDGTQRLMVTVHPTKPLVYEVYLEDECDPDKRWSNTTMVGTFTLKLKEPDPVKRVIRQLVTTTSESSRQLRVQMTSQKAITIAWGDGTYSEDLNGSIDITHTYPEGAATYYAIISGVIEDITDFSTTGIVIWNKI